MPAARLHFDRRLGISSWVSVNGHRPLFPISGTSTFWDNATFNIWMMRWMDGILLLRHVSVKLDADIVDTLTVISQGWIDIMLSIFCFEPPRSMIPKFQRG